VIHPDGCPPVVHDPAAPALPLVFEIAPLFLRVRGRVAGLAADEHAGLGVTLLPAEEPEASRGWQLARLAPDGGFELLAPRGRHELFLIEAAPGGWRTILTPR
jgi:hypothetical protein